MKNHSLTILYAISLIAGVLLTIYWQEADIFSWIVIALGILLLIPCVVCLIAAFVPQKTHNPEGPELVKSRRSFAWTMILSGIGGTILGLLMICLPNFFVQYIVYTFGVILIIFSCVQLSFVSPAMRVEKISGWFLAVPVATLAAGVIIICIGQEKIQAAAALITGLILIFYSVNGFVSVIGRRTIDRRMASSSQPAENAREPQDVEAVDAE